MNTNKFKVGDIVRVTRPPTLDEMLDLKLYWGNWSRENLLGPENTHSVASVGENVLVIKGEYSASQYNQHITFALVGSDTCELVKQPIITGIDWGSVPTKPEPPEPLPPVIAERIAQEALKRKLIEEHREFRHWLLG